MKNTEEERRNLNQNALRLPSGRRARASEPTPRWVLAFGLVAGALFLCFVVLHLTGHGLGHHGSGPQTTEHRQNP